jgi:alpha-tubulin suppressor-like RCC1 family protein
MRDGSVRCWGANEAGQLGDGTLADRSRPTQVLGIVGAVSIVAEGSRTCAVLGDGTARCWGLFERHSIGCMGPRLNCADSVSASEEPTPRVLPIQRVAELRLGDHHACARIEGENGVHCWGANGAGELGVHLPTYKQVLPGGGGSVTERTLEERGTNDPQHVLW